MDLVELSTGKWRVHLAGKSIGEISQQVQAANARQYGVKA
jgi:hypothetical protein